MGLDQEQKDTQTRDALLTAARALLAEKPNFSLKTLLDKTSISRARFRRCFADKPQLLAALTVEDVKGLGEILQAAQPASQALSAAVGSDIVPAAPVAQPVASASPPADAWLERRLRVFERALSGLEKRQENSEQALTLQLGLIGEKLAWLASAKDATAAAPQIEPVVEKPVLFEIKPKRAELAKLWLAENHQAQIQQKETQKTETQQSEAQTGRAEPEPAGQAQITPAAVDLTEIPPIDVPRNRPRPIDLGPMPVSDDPFDLPPSELMPEDALLAPQAFVEEAGLVGEKEISDFIAHARQMAQRAAQMERAPPPHGVNMRWLAWGGAVVIVLLFCAGMLLVSGALGGTAGARPVANSGVSHRQLAQDGFGKLIALADSGDAKAQTVLALAYLRGQGVKSDEDAAKRWGRAAAAQGQPVAQYLVGTLYLEGDKNESEAARWFLAAAAQGNVKAMHNLAIAFAEGLGVEKDPAEAVKWFLRAAGEGYRDSQFDLAVLYERGLGVPQSARMALKWYLVAANAGDTPSAARAAVLKSQMDPLEIKAATQDATSFVPQQAGSGANETPTL